MGNPPRPRQVLILPSEDASLISANSNNKATVSICLENLVVFCGDTDGDKTCQGMFSRGLGTCACVCVHTHIYIYM